MKKNNISNIFIFIGFAYLAFRTYLQIQNATPMSWLVYAIELITVLELCFIYFAVTHQKKRNKKQREMITDAVAIIDARNCSQDELIASLYSIEESSEFDRALVLRNAVTNEVAFENIADYKKAILTEKIEITSNPKFIAWMNAGDVILEDTISQASAYFTDSIAVVFPKSALWSNEISNGSSPENSDIINDEVNAFISSTSSQEWAGESCIFTSEFFSENITSNVQNANFFATINKALNVAKAKSVYIDVIGFEQQDNNAFSRIETRTNEIRVGTKSLFRDGFKKSSIANLRYATRPLRALRTIAFFVVAGISVLTGKIPFPNSNIAIMFGACAFYVCALLAIKFLSNKRLDQISRIRTSLANLGSDLTSWLKKNTAIAKRINTFAGAALAIYLASCLVARWFLNFGNDVKSQNSAPALLFGIISLGYLVYGLELVGFKQRRNTLRRILNINAKFGRRAIEIADLSPSDCGVISSRPTEIGHEEVISLSIPQGNTTKEIHLQSRVVNSTKVGVNYRIGFVFESMSDEDKAILTKFCTLTYPLYVLRGHSRIAGDSSATDVSLATQKKTTSSITFLRNQSQKPLVRIAAIVALFAVAASNLPPYSRASAATTTGTANTISGVIFQDFNTNGVKDPGTTGSATDAPIAGVTVKATCDNSGVTTTGSATSNDKGEFIISNVTGQCRVETTSGIPTGMKSSQAGTDSNTLVQFHRSGTANVMFGLQYPGDYCQNNPNVLVTCFGRGNITVTYPNKGSIESNTWNSTSDWTDTVKFGKVGTVYGLAYKKDTKELFSSAYLRRKAGFGPMGIGGIYKTSLGTAGNPVTNWLNLETVAQKYGETLGANPRPANQTQYDLAVNDYETEPYVGRRGIGDIDISPDGKTLYATNLNTGSIYAIEIANPQNTQRLSITGTLNTSAGRTCSRTANANDFRIFGLGVKSNGDVFVGGVCTAQSTQNPNDLYYYVFKFDPSNNYSQKLVSTHDLKYDRSKAPNPWQSRVAGTPYPDSSKRNTTVTRWEPWQDRQQTRFVNDETYLYPYPQVSDITFDGNDLIVGMRDIYADTTPPNGVPQPGQPFFWGAAQGDLVRLCGSTTSDQYVLESNRSCPDGRKATGATPNYDESFNGELSFDTNHHMTNGPGGGEWFTGEDPWEYYGEGALGAIAKPGGFNTFLATQSDPSNYQFFGNTTSAWAAGTRWFNASAGTSSRGTTVYNPNQSDWTFSKAGGLGDLEVLCDEAPLQIGNRVWLDENGNGIQDPAENGIGGIGVELVDANNTVVKSTTTNASGEYLFSNVAKNTPYTVRVIASSVAGAVPTTANAGSNDSIDSDGVLGANDYISTSVVGHVAGDNDHTYDFGFKPVYALGNQVFDDVNNNGLKDANEVGIAGVAVTLLKSDGTATGKTTTTNANGNYYFANLDPGSYIVQIVAPAGYISSTGINAKASGPYEPAPSPDTSANLKVDNDDNGTTKNNVIVSLPVTLGKGKQPVGELEGDKINTPDNQNDYTVDFGLFKPSSLGDRVWNDTNKDGIQTTGETGVSGVNVTLYINACGVGGTAIATTTTDANGIYSFGNLAPGNYYVAFQLPNGSVFTQALAGSDRTLDSNANTSTGCSEQITLPVGTTNNTIDAGIKPAIVPIDLTLKKAITNKPPSGSTYKPGDVVNYELTVGNIGDGVAQVGFKVSDVLPSGLTYQGGATASGYSCSVTGQKLECISDHTLAKGVTEKITYHAVIANTFSTSTNSLQNVATITPSVNDVVEDNPLTNCDATGGSVGGKTCNNVDNQSFGLPIDLRVVKSIDTSKNPSYKPGTNVEYLLTVTNNGPATAKSGFKVEDALPSELNFISATGTGYTCNASGQDITCTSDHTLAVGTTDVIRVIAKIKPDLVITGQAIKNIATVKPSTQEPYGETVPVDPCNADGSNKNECNNRDPEVFNVPNGASLGDYVFYDLNHNGIQDATEKGIANVTVELHVDSCTSTAVKTTTTDASGNYIFTNLTPGTSYIVKFVASNGRVITTQNVGSDDSKDSDAASNGCSSPVVLSDGEFNQSIDAGMYLPWASIGDFVFLDVNKNGIQDAGEAGVNGVTVSLRDSSGAVIKTTTTSSDGKYVFNNLEPGDYSIAFVIPNGYSLSPANAGGDDTKDSDPGSNGITSSTTLSAGENDMTWDMGIYVTPASLGDYVWYDDDNNGRQDSGEDPVTGVTVYLFGEVCGVGTPLGQTTTDANGKYKFDNLAPGVYTVKFVKPVGTSFALTNYLQGDNTHDSDADASGCSAPVTLQPGDNNTTVDAGIVVLASLGDFVWLDSNRDGIQQDSEEPIPGIRVILLDKDSNPIAGKETVTDDNGFYIFDGLKPGTYIVQFDKNSVPVQLQFSVAGAGSDRAKDSNANVSTGKTDAVTLKAGEQNLTIDAGLNPVPASLGDFVWEDTNKNGIQDSGEKGIANVTVNLYLCDADVTDPPVATTKTDANGKYIFEGLEPDDYVVEFIKPDGYTLTGTFAGTDEKLDSDAETDGYSWCVELPPGENDMTIDAGMYKPAVPPVQVLPNVVTRGGKLPFTGGQASQLLAFALSAIGAGILLTGFFTQRRKKFRFF